MATEYIRVDGHLGSLPGYTVEIILLKILGAIKTSYGKEIEFEEKYA